MPAPENLDALLALVRDSGLVEEGPLKRLVSDPAFPQAPDAALEALVRANLLTPFQSSNLAQGKYKGMVLGPYKVLRPIARGGMGIIYLGEHADLKRRVAVKVLMRDLPENMAPEERFQREGRAIAALDHPGIVRVHDIGRDAGQLYLVMEYVEGKSFEQLIRETGGLPPHLAADYALQVADALRHAHARGVIHRDVKPANLLLTQEGAVKVLDMGLARFYDDPTDDLTRRVGKDTVLGSPDYISPEQALHQVSPRSDIYSLGATLYAMLLGEPPFTAPTAPQKLMAHQLNPVTPPHRKDRRIPPELSQLVVRMLAKRPEDRPANCTEVIEALRPFATPDVAPQAAGGPPPAGDGPAGRRAWVWVAAGAAALLAAGVAAWAALRGPG